MKKLDKWMPYELTANQKDPHFEVSSSLILSNHNEPFLNQIVMHDEKWILYNQGQPAQWLDQENAPKPFPKPNLHPLKRSRSLFGGLLPVQSATVFWIPVKPLHQRSMLSKLMRCTELQRLQPVLVNLMGPILHSYARLQVTQAMLQKLKESGYEVLPHLPYLLDLSPTITSSSISTIFWRENTSTTNRRQKMLSKSSSNPKA